jgi:hypothetical protein
MACLASTLASGYRPRESSGSALYQLVADQRASFERVAAEAGGVPAFVHESFAACPRCGGRLRHIATILDPRAARKLLEHLGLPARAPPEQPPRDPPPFWRTAAEALL